MVRSRKTWLFLGLLVGSAAQALAQPVVPELEEMAPDVISELADPATEGFVPLQSALQAELAPNGPAPDKYDLGAAEVYANPAGETCGISCRYEPWRLFPQEGLFRTYGWVDAGAPLNFSSPTSGFNGPQNAQFRDDVQLNQLYGIVEAPIDRTQCFGVGGRIDVMYGADYLLAQSDGLERNADATPRWNGDNDHGLAIPQAYGEVLWGAVSVKLGHFYTVVGYEGVPAPANFFYTKSYAYTYAGPFTHWGALATVDVTNRLVVDAGVVNGWDALDQVSNQPSFLGRATYYTTDLRTSRWVGSIITGDEPGANGGYANRTRIDTFFDCLLSDRWRYVLQYNHAWQEEGLPGGETATWYGLANYAYYTVNCAWKVGGRLEWFRDQNGTRVGGALPQNPNTGPFAGSFYEAAVGANWTPTSNLLVRPELRFDWFDGSGVPFDDGNRTNQTLAAIDAVLFF